MNKILLALVIIGTFYINAVAQKTNHKVPHLMSHKKAVVKDTVIMNFRVCKSDNGHAICGEAPGNNNSTFEEPQKPEKHPVYEADRSDVITLKGKPEVPKVKFPMDKPGPETQSGTWIGVCSWNGIW